MTEEHGERDWNCCGLTVTPKSRWLIPRFLKATFQKLNDCLGPVHLTVPHQSYLFQSILYLGRSPDLSGKLSNSLVSFFISRYQTTGRAATRQADIARRRRSACARMFG